MVKESRQAEDPEKPWRKKGCTDEERLTVRAAIVDYDENDIDGERIRRGDKRALIEVPLEDSTDPTSDIDLRDFDILVDQGERWRMEDVNKVDPADVVVVYDVQLRA